MSKYMECQTVIGDRKFLVAALAELGYHVEVHPEGAALFGYEGRERPEDDVDFVALYQQRMAQQEKPPGLAPQQA